MPKLAGKRIDGHLAGLSTDFVNIYRTAFVLNDHEVTTKEEALDRIRRGMYVMLREGSVAKNVLNVLPAVNEKMPADSFSVRMISMWMIYWKREALIIRSK